MTGRGPRRAAVAPATSRAHRRRALAMLAACAAVLLPGQVAAHASLVKSSPARRAALGTPPAKVELTFSERLEPAYAAVSVWDAQGRRVDREDATVPREDSRRLTVSLPVLPPGSYTVRFRVLSVDGHVVESSFPFSVRSPAR
jgi:methionine-rich copper-binding protein CopC